MQGIDSALIVLDSIDGIKIQSEKLIKQAKELNLPMALFINKLEREHSNYKSVITGIEKSFEAKPVLIQMPIGEETSFKGIINLLEEKAYIYEQNESGKFSVQDIPADLKAEADSLRGQSIESIVECDDEVLEKYLEGQTLTAEEIQKALKKGIINCQITPVLFGSALKNIGVIQALDFIKNYLPSPVEKRRNKSIESGWS